MCGRRGADLARFFLHYPVATGENIERVWDERGSLATGGLERRGKVHKENFIGGTSRRQNNRWHCTGYKSILQRRNLDWALELVI